MKYYIMLCGVLSTVAACSPQMNTPVTEAAAEEPPAHGILVPLSAKGHEFLVDGVKTADQYIENAPEHSDEEAY